MRKWRGEKYTLELTGSSHGDYVGAVFSGIGKGKKIDFDEIDRLIELRKPNLSAYSTRRRESDEYEFISGADASGLTTGEDVAVRIGNTDVKKSDYDKTYGLMRPSHADYAAFVKYGESALVSGGGMFSGRMTAPLCVIGGMAQGILKNDDIKTIAYLSGVGDIKFGSYDDEDFVMPRDTAPFATATPEKIGQSDELFSRLSESGDSVGGVIECVALGVPAGTGDAQFGCLESKISSLLFAIPAVKAVEFGYGVKFATACGSEVRDEPYYAGGTVKTKTNFNGGINGGISNGMPICVRVTIKPTPSIGKPCDTINVLKKTNEKLALSGRHDVCIAPRAVPAVASAVSIALLDSSDK